MSNTPEVQIKVEITIGESTITLDQHSDMSRIKTMNDALPMLREHVQGLVDIARSIIPQPSEAD